ncbi:CLUMA_CG009096, isoform A [Clunio marinus]|uniref:CLUMA_CG009096, isoform A n=1 Tax=Clunio marinus TaxID=568069 RepID=A0A1J1I9I9_9DIPT|nr:CLUMA_CG009096, isoform A [Clunio marinus]
MLSLSYLVSCEILAIDNDNKTTVDKAFCFRFTWLGPKYNEDSKFRNATCSDIVKDKTVPCTHPLVVTNNSNIPDTDYIWNKYQNKPIQVACRLVRGEVCAKFSYKFNGAIENITYLCTKVNIENETAVSQGCYKQMKNGHEIEVCVCESKAGKIPCNCGKKFELNFLFIAILLFPLIHFMIDN